MKQRRWRIDQGVIIYALSLATFGTVHAGVSEAPSDARRATLSIPTEISQKTRRPIIMSDLLMVRDIGGVNGKGLSVSPDGAWVAFELHRADVEKNGYSAAWFVSPTSGKTSAKNVGDAGEADLFRAAGGAWLTAAPQWTADSAAILYRRKVHGSVQIWRSSRDGRRQEQLTNNEADVLDFNLDSDGSFIVFSTGAPQAVIERMEIADAKRGYLFGGGDRWSYHEGKLLAKPFDFSGGSPRLWVYELGTGIERPATEMESEAYADSRDREAALKEKLNARVVRFSPSMGAVAWLAPADPDLQGFRPPLVLHVSNDNTGEGGERCPAVECTGQIDVSEETFNGHIQWSDSEKEIYFARREGTNYGIRVLYEWSLDKKEIRQILATSDWISDCSVVNGSAICFRQTPRTARAVIRVDLGDGSITTLVDPNPEFVNVQLGEVTRMEWGVGEDFATYGFLVKPPNYDPQVRYPLAIVGYRAKRAFRGGTGDEYPVQLFAANGFVTLVYEAPEHWDAAARMSAAELWEWHWNEGFDTQASVASLESVVELLGNQGLVDTARVGITGFSTGVGHVSAALLQSNGFAAAIVSSGGANPIGYYLSGYGVDHDHRRLARKMGFGPTSTEEDWSYERYSMALNVERIDAPLLVNVSDSEYLRAVQLAIHMMDSNKPFEMYVYPNEQHVKWHPAHRYYVYARNVDWFNYWLNNVVDENPAKVNQYNRWRRLRRQEDSPAVTGGIRGLQNPFVTPDSPAVISASSALE